MPKMQEHFSAMCGKKTPGVATRGSLLSQNADYIG